MIGSLLLILVTCVGPVATLLWLDPGPSVTREDGYDSEFGWAQPFDQTLWRDFPEDRLNMARDVCVKRRLDGLTLAQVQDLLGPSVQPDSVSPEADETLWYAGMDIIDPNYIHVRFDDQSRVTTYALVQH